MEAMTIVRAVGSDHIKAIEALAYEIIPEFYAGIVPHDHNMFFVEKFQSAAAIEAQLKGGYEYYLMAGEEGFLGYFGVQIDEAGSSMLLSKL